MKAKTKHKVIIKIDTNELYNNWVNSNRDCITYSAERGESMAMIERMKMGMIAILYSDVSEIRRLFASGYTVMLMGDHMEVIDVPLEKREKRELEVRIYSYKDFEPEILTIVTEKELTF